LACHFGPGGLRHELDRGGALEERYSQVRSFVSELGRRGAAHPWIFDVSVTIWGLGFIALGVAALTALSQRRWGWIVARCSCSRHLRHRRRPSAP